MQKIIIIGCCGSGKTTLAKDLAKKLDLPLIHLDKINWHGNWQTISKEEFDSILQEEVQKDKWIIDGNYNRTIPLRLKNCDTVIYLDFPIVLSLCGVMQRVMCNYGKTRDDMGGNCPERFDWEFIKFVLSFNRKHRKKYYSLLEAETDKNIIILRNRHQVKKFLAEIK